jgi:arginine decarboxylase
MTPWSIEQADETYSLKHWNGGYFKIRDDGHLVMSIDDGAKVDLAALPARISDQGLELPALVRFMDILDARLDRLCQAFEQARTELDYAGTYTAIYPIKVNQQQTVVARLLSHGGPRIGLEAGSKPELLAVMAQSRPGALVICNGYKDREYVRLALIGQKMGLKVHIVIEKISELETIRKESEKLQVKPFLGVRVRLASLGAGKWQNTGGEKAKFGLSAAQVLTLCSRLKEWGMLDSLQLLHSHMGSQISNLDDIRQGLKEASRYFAELHRLGAPVGIVDVGGGLGIDYEGTRSQSFCSMDYALEDYARVVVEALATICKEKGLPQPQLLTEAGRAMTAHHAILLTNVIDIEQVTKANWSQPTGEMHPLLQQFQPLFDRSSLSPADRYQSAQLALKVIQQHYSAGKIALEQRAEADQLYYSICRDIAEELNTSGVQSDLKDEINARLADKLFCNFSVFQSIPDVWAFDQIFPVMPLQRLDEPPLRRAVLQDLTCDSDGHIEYYVDASGIERTLPVHELRAGEPYVLGIFLVGAYQEILGDLHNLFGDTHAINVELTDNGYQLVNPEPGDRIDELLRYVHYDTDRVMTSLERLASNLEPAQRASLIRELAEGLQGYTYHED